MNKNAKRIALLGALASMAVVLAYVEVLLPPLFSAVPGIKMGLPNIVILLVLYRFGVKDAAAVSLVRLAIATLLFGNVMTLLYSVAGAALSLTLMALLRKTRRFSSIGVSIVGGVSHNLGQILVAMLLLETPAIGYYMILLTLSGTLAGLLIGIAGNALLQFFNKISR